MITLAEIGGFDHIANADHHSAQLAAEPFLKRHRETHLVASVEDLRGQDIGEGGPEQLLQLAEAGIAVRAVRDCLARPSPVELVRFVCFSARDLDVYQRLLSAD